MKKGKRGEPPGFRRPNGDVACYRAHPGPIPTNRARSVGIRNASHIPMLHWRQVHLTQRRSIAVQNIAVSAPAGLPATIIEATEVGRRIAQNIATVIVGKDEVIEQALAALIAEGHILVEDVPGVGKTMLARALAISIGGTFSRIQFTPDLLPSDVTGVSVYNQSTEEFSFRSGPIAAQLVLADEINRATPKTQSALLEAMEERQITVDGITHPLPPPFLVIATQNSIEYEGTFPLPEAQLDRFLIRMSVGYPKFAEGNDDHRATGTYASNYGSAGGGESGTGAVNADGRAGDIR